MIDQSQITMTLHGLQADNGLVRADVFLEKFRTILNSLKLADKEINGRKSHNFIVAGLKVASAQAQLREKISRRRDQPSSSIAMVKDAFSAIYFGEKNLERFPPQLIATIAPLAKNIGKSFSHGEIRFDDTNVIRIDDYFAKQVDRTRARIRGDIEASFGGFEGISFGVFDGQIKEIDARGSLVRGKLTLSAGGREIDCIFKVGEIEMLRSSFDRRARVEGVAHYDGISLLPVRLDVKNIEVVKTDPNLGVWKGRLARRNPEIRLGQ